MNLNGAVFQKNCFFVPGLSSHCERIKIEYYYGDKTRISKQGASVSNLKLFHILTSLVIYAMLIAWLCVA
jgi:hypothetical protein